MPVAVVTDSTAYLPAECAHGVTVVPLYVRIGGVERREGVDVSPAEVAEALPFVRSVRERGVTILMIEHLVAALMSVSDRVLVLDRGRLIASGPSDEVQRNPAVIEAYLGEEPTNARG